MNPTRIIGTVLVLTTVLTNVKINNYLCMVLEKTTRYNIYISLVLAVYAAIMIYIGSKQKSIIEPKAAKKSADKEK
jgi:hypothetical protein